MATMRYQTTDAAQAAGLGWSLAHYPGPDPEDVSDDRPKATAAEKLFRFYNQSWHLAYIPGDEYPLEETPELKTWPEIEGEAVRRARGELQKASMPEVSAAVPEAGKVCPEPGCGAILPQRGFGPHLAKHRRERTLL